MRFEPEWEERKEHHRFGKGRFIHEHELEENHFMRYKSPREMLRW